MAILCFVFSCTTTYHDICSAASLPDAESDDRAPEPPFAARAMFRLLKFERGEMSDGTELAASGPQRPDRGYVGFTIKVETVPIAISVGLVLVLNSIVDTFVNTVDTRGVRTKLRTAFKDDKTLVRLKGLLTDNPAVNYRVSATEEAKENFDAAIEEIESALGLIELHASDRTTREEI